MDFVGKVAIVTGGAQGIGRAYTSELLNKGLKVCICDIKEDIARGFIENLQLNLRNNVIFQKCDVTSFAEFKNAFDRVIHEFGRIDVLINNAGILSEKDWKKSIEINFVGVVHGIKLALEYMGIDKGGHGGNIVNTASRAGLGCMPVGPVYTATKYAVVGLTKSYGSDYHLKKTGVKVNAICPGPVETEFLRTMPELTFDEKGTKDFLETVKSVKPEQVGKALMRVLEDGKNGSLLRVDADGLCYT